MNTLWKPMTEAPQDGSRILVWTHRNHYEIAHWDDDKYAKRSKPFWATTGPWGKHEMREHAPLAWTTLPAPPNT